jgi:hypothetical protein
MHFDQRELQLHAEPVLTSELNEGTVYFAVTYVDSEMLIPTFEAIVFIGRDLEPSDQGQAYFQDIRSHRDGVRYDWDTDDGEASFFCGSEDELDHIFTFEHALEELMRCSLRRRKTAN